tara:strand:- start:139 stop:363 length:225 start_codon:yes stop_codon:yes gene_type:complete
MKGHTMSKYRKELQQRKTYYNISFGLIGTLITCFSIIPMAVSLEYGHTFNACIFGGMYLYGAILLLIAITVDLD